MKRIAIQLFGHLRTFEYTYHMLIKNVVEANKADGYEVDIFIHTWNELDHSTVNYRNVNGQPLTDRQLLQSDIKKAKEVYKPASMSIEKQLQHEEIIMIERIENVKRSIIGCYNMAYSMHRSSELRQEYEKANVISYDWVIVTRPDILFNTEFRIDDFLYVYAKNGIEIANDAIFHACNPFFRGKVQEPLFLTGSDLIYFATTKNIDKATALFEDFENNIDINNFYCMEVWWDSYWQKVGLRALAILYRHGPEFETVQTNRFNHLIENNAPVNNVAIKCKNNTWKYHYRRLRLLLMKALPYFLVNKRITRLKQKLEANKYI